MWVPAMPRSSAPFSSSAPRTLSIDSTLNRCSWSIVIEISNGSQSSLVIMSSGSVVPLGRALARRVCLSACPRPSSVTASDDKRALSSRQCSYHLRHYHVAAPLLDSTVVRAALFSSSSFSALDETVDSGEILICTFLKNDIID